MSKLIQLRQRIKAIETIKKITHAMRLIAMSTQSQLKASQKPFSAYIDELETIFSKLIKHTPEWNNPIIHPSDNSAHRTLVIVVGSQKGLCGSFNTNLFKLLNTSLEDYNNTNTTFITVGQKVIDFFRTKKNITLQHSYEKFTMQKLPTIAQELAHTIMTAREPYSHVIFYSNTFKSFFAQIPKKITLIPFEKKEPTKVSHTEYLWEQPAEELLNSFLHQYIESRIHFILFESLLSEHAARFVSMNAATRNAENLTDAAKLQYNKLRQAKITKELTELVGSFTEKS